MERPKADSADVLDGGLRAGPCGSATEPPSPIQDANQRGRSMGRLEQKVVIVTGAGKGLGEASALRFAAEGAAVMCVDVDAPAAQSTADAITADGGKAAAFVGDVADEASMTAMAATTIDLWARIDVLYANAGTTATGASAHTCAMDVWQRLLAVNLTGAFVCAKVVLPAMMEQRSGSIILQASGAAILGVRGSAPYAA